MVLVGIFFMASPELSLFQWLLQYTKPKKKQGGQAAFAFPALALLLVIQPDEQRAA
jgi:hypothetical protein